MSISNSPAGSLVSGADRQGIKTIRFPRTAAIGLDCGESFGPLTIAYETYGVLNETRSNAVLICHALTGDQYVASRNPVTGKPGWWDIMVGPGKPIDTDQFFVVCSNVLGGCMGTSGPASLNETTGRYYGLDMPVVTIRDMVRAQSMLIDHLGIEQLFCVVGGSMGGMQALQWAASYPDRVFSAVLIATGARHSSQNIAFHEVGRQAVMADPDWRGGRYLEDGVRPEKGLAVARMAAHITYMSEDSLHGKFGRKLQNCELSFSFAPDFQIENYLRYKGSSFVERFDANSYLYVTRAMDYFDLAADYGGVLAHAFKGSKTRFCVASFTSDWLFPTSESRNIAHAINAGGGSVSFVEIETEKGHDAFLLDVPELLDTVRGFIDARARERGLSPAERASRSAEANRSVRNMRDRARADHQLISGMIERETRVLDVGCGDGELLQLLVNDRNVAGRGVEISQPSVNLCVARGLSVIQGDADSDLADYPDDHFDYVILSQTLQATGSPKTVLENMLRIGRRVIVSFPNFGYWPVRFQLMLQGRMPLTGALMAPWHQTANIHLCTIGDFIELADQLGARIERSVILDGRGKRVHPRWMWNVFGEQAVFLLSRKD